MKSHAYFDLFGLERFCVKWQDADPELLEQLISELSQSEQTIRAGLAQRADELVEAQQAFLLQAMGGRA